MLIKSKVTIVAHNGEFHADDAFAVASLFLLVGNSKRIKIVRTRDGGIIQKAEYVVDVGGVHDPVKNRFDHHQIGGAGERQNSIPYASFGLVWKAYGEKICGSAEVAALIDQRLVQPIDALDNGVAICKEIVPGVRAYDISSIIGAMNPHWNEASEPDAIFSDAVSFAKKVLTREIKDAQSVLEAEKFVIEAYEKSVDKRIIILEKHFPWEQVISKFKEPLYVIFPKDNNWRVKAVRNNDTAFENRKNLPQSWAGKRGKELSAVTGVPGCVFCHNKLFVTAADSKEAALRLAQIAVAA